jgi:hypothetical protein
MTPPQNNGRHFEYNEKTLHISIVQRRTKRREAILIITEEQHILN